MGATAAATVVEALLVLEVDTAAAALCWLAPAAVEATTAVLKSALLLADEMDAIDALSVLGAIGVEPTEVLAVAAPVLAVDEEVDVGFESASCC